MIRTLAALALLAGPGLVSDGPLRALPPDAELDDPPVYRYGLTLGGTSLVSLVFEIESNNRAIEFALGTFSWRDVSLGVSGKQYLGRGSVRGLVGAGFWGVAAFPADQRSGFAFIARAPVGVDWHALERHAVGVELGFNRALAMRRPDPVDERPPRTRIVPLPSFYYRFADPR